MGWAVVIHPLWVTLSYRDLWLEETLWCYTVQPLQSADEETGPDRGSDFHVHTELLTLLVDQRFLTARLR